MFARCNFSVILVLGWLQYCFTIDLNTLRFVHAVWRHGDRSPAHVNMPTDTKNGVDSWPQGWGELTQLGMLQQYSLGRFLRNRYDGFVSSTYDKYQVYIRSTSYNRTIMSAQSNMAGFFEPQGSQVWNPAIHWQPIPIHSRPKLEDPMLITDLECPVEDKLYLESLKSPEVKQIEEKYADLFRLLSEKSGEKIDSLFDISHAFDPLNCQMRHNTSLGGNHTWPDWVTWEVFERIHLLYDIMYSHYFSTAQMRKFRGGLLLGDVTDRMIQKKDDKIDDRLRYYAYSGHDTTLTAFLQSLGAFNNKHPPYASVILIELHERNNQFIVELWYKNETDKGSDQIYQLSIGDCPDPCSLSEFDKRSRPLIPNDWQFECGINVWLGLRQRTWLQLLVCLCGVLIALSLLLIFILCCLVKERVKYKDRNLVPTTVDSPDSDIV